MNFALIFDCLASFAFGIVVAYAAHRFVRYRRFQQHLRAFPSAKLRPEARR